MLNMGLRRWQLLGNFRQEAENWWLGAWVVKFLIRVSCPKGFFSLGCPGAVKIVWGKKFIMSNWGSTVVAICWLTKVWFVSRRENFPMGWLASISNRQIKIFQEGKNGVIQ